LGVLIGLQIGYIWLLIFIDMTPSFVAFVVIATTLAVLIGIFIDLSKK